MKTFTIKGTEVTKGIDVMATAEMQIVGIPLGQGLHKSLSNQAYGTVLRLHNLDVISDPQDPQGAPGRIVKEVNRRDPRALLLIEAGLTSLLANWRRERLINNRVVREDVAITEAVGVEVLADYEDENGTQWLVALAPGASLRVKREGIINKGDFESLVVEWHGGWSPKATDDSRPDFLECRSDMRNWNLKVRPRYPFHHKQ